MNIRGSGNRLDYYSTVIGLGRTCYGSRHELEYNILNGVVIEEGYVRVTMRV